nr:hypothetical protein [Tanacetum cinerariifolium]
SDKNKEGLGYSVVPPPIAQIYSSPKKGLSWTGLLKFADDTITDYSRPSSAIESTSDYAQNKNPSVTETGASDSTILSKPAIKFMKAVDRAAERSTTTKVEAVKKSSVRYAELYRKPLKKPNEHSYANRPLQRTSTVRSQYKAPWVPIVNKNFPPVNRKLPTAVNMSLTDINASLTEHNLHQQCKLFSRGNSSTQQWEHFFTSSGKITLAVGTILHYQWQNNYSSGNSAVGMIFTNSGKILLAVGTHH